MVQAPQESFPGSPLVPALISIAALVIAALVFLFCCYAAASDGQGAILFLLCSPMLVFAQVVAWINEMGSE